MQEAQKEKSPEETGLFKTHRAKNELRLGFGFRSCGCSGRNGRGFLFLAASALDAGGLALQITEVIKTSAANLAFAYHFDGANRGGMQREDALDAHTEAYSPDCKRCARGTPFLRDHHAFKGLEPLLFLLALAFLEADVHANGIARAKLGEVFAQLRVMQFTNCRVHVRASFLDPLRRGQLSRDK